MKIVFKNKKLEKIFNADKELNKNFGKLAKKIKMRLAVLRAAPNLSAVPNVPPERRHKLSGDKIGLWAVDLDANYRLIFEPVTDCDHNEINLTDITAITIISIEDYH